MFWVVLGVQRTLKIGAGLGNLGILHVMVGMGAALTVCRWKESLIFFSP